ncbi:MAG: hypothetical protein RLZZ437_544 [Pseudomonadota bacterium]
MRYISLFALFSLAACAPAPNADVTMARPTAGLSTASGPATAQLSTVAATTVSRSNSSIARDFMDLAFRMESGRAIPAMSRFEGPITVALTGAVPATAAEDLGRVLARFRAEAGIDVQATGGAASITVEFLPRRTMQSIVPTAACFVVPRVSSWDEYRAARNSAALDWTTVRVRDRVAIFVPSDTTPQEVRDCLHEELAQAMGPLNDLYRLSDSVFNDDNFHTTLTGFDMLVLRAFYAPELQAGMGPGDVAAALPSVLARLNPAGGSVGVPSADIDPRSWTQAIETALGQRGSTPARKAAAERAVAIARAQGWGDNRLAFSYYALGRVNVGSDVAQAVVAFSQAQQIYQSLPGGGVHAAHVDMQMAAFALSSGQSDEALRYTDRAIPVVRQAENAALLATLLLLRAEALEIAGRGAEASALRLDTAGLARYGFGSDAQVRARTSEIAALGRRGGRG